MRTTVALLSCLAQALRPRIVSRLSAKPERANVLRIGCKMRPGVWIQLADHFRPLAWSYSEKLTSFVLRAKVVVSRVLTFSNITNVRHAYPQKGLVDAGSWQSAAREVGLRGGDRAPAVVAVSASISAARDAQVLPNSASGCPAGRRDFDGFLPPGHNTVSIDAAAKRRQVAAEGRG